MPARRGSHFVPGSPSSPKERSTRTWPTPQVACQGSPRPFGCRFMADAARSRTRGQDDSQPACKDKPPPVNYSHVLLRAERNRRACPSASRRCSIDSRQGLGCSYSFHGHSPSAEPMSLSSPQGPHPRRSAGFIACREESVLRTVTQDGRPRRACPGSGPPEECVFRVSLFSASCTE